MIYARHLLITAVTNVNAESLLARTALQSLQKFQLCFDLMLHFPVLHSVEISGFSITQILREINFWDSRSAKYAILSHSEALNFDFNQFLHKLIIFRATNITKMAVSAILDSPKLISRKI